MAVLAVVPFLLGYREPEDLPALVGAGRKSTIRITPDLAWAWAGRFLITLGFALVTRCSTT
ncbi:hypothetical protein L6E12_23410 [Actinokineospora sp. PR83]|uniref:hypothetical protein n=1 Tax=Actinokineospora sp. PR83 TaxID=2884908 RepID=UPI001F2C525E|nr:hypothetical protein [Actinokineospora sp. PR83]MCG8918733.1 hypothetical protein [Actinokineospora sp. PR83]